MLKVQSGKCLHLLALSPSTLPRARESEVCCSYRAVTALSREIKVQHTKYGSSLLGPQRKLKLPLLNKVTIYLAVKNPKLNQGELILKQQTKTFYFLKQNFTK